MLSQSHHLARTTAAATAARSNARPGRRLARTRVAAAVAAAALLASACSAEEPPAPTAEETATTTTAAAAPADTAAPDTTAAPAVTSPCTDPDAEDLGDGLVELNGIVYEVYADACVQRHEEPDGDEDDTPAQDTPTTTTDAEPATESAVEQPSGSGSEQVCIDDVCLDVPEDGGPVELPEGFANHEHPPETEPETTITEAPEPETDPESEPTTTVAPEPDPEPTSTTVAPEPEPETATTTTTPEPTSTTLAPEPEPTTTVAPEPEDATTPTVLTTAVGETISLVVPMEEEPQNPDGTWPPRRFERVDIQVGETIHLVLDPDSVGNPMEHEYSPELPCVLDLGCYEPVHLSVGSILVLPDAPDQPVVVVRIDDWIVFHNIWVCWLRSDPIRYGYTHGLHRWTAPPTNEVMEGIYSIENNLGDYHRPC